MNKAIHYAHLLHDGNPGAFWFLAGCAAFIAIVFFITPLTDEEFDSYMQAYDEAEADLEFDLRRAA
jgi:hypothetical protein